MAVDDTTRPRTTDPMPADHLGRILRRSVERFGPEPAMRFEDGAGWRALSYTELGRRVRALARGLVEAGVQPGDTVGIFSPNRPEWTIADLAILTVGAVVVPVYATNTAAQADYVLTDAGVSLVFVGGQKQYDAVLAGASTGRPRHIVVFDDSVDLAPGDSDAGRTDSCEHLSTLLARGEATAHLDAEVDARLAAAGTDDLMTLVYTSGTTGDPKGAMLTHANLVHQLRALDERFRVGPGDSSLCFLPLSHVYERAWSFYLMANGVENCYLSDPKRVVEAMAEVRPTTMVSVPRLYEKIHATVLDRVERGSAIKARLFHWAIGVGGEYQRRRYAGDPVSPLLRAEHALADRLVLAKIRDVVGGDKKVFSAGGAPLAQAIEEFFFAAGLLVCQGYGLTETTAMLTCNHPGAFRFGSVGTAVLGTELRLADTGEIQVRGGNVMTGYFGRPEDTAAAFTDGWFRTGDVGTIDADGFVYVTDRIKDIIITSQGKNVAPQHVEGVLGGDPYIEQVAVFGDRRSYLTALIEPAFPLLERYADEQGLSYGSWADLVALPEVTALYDERIAAVSVELAGYEQVKRYSLLARPFTQEGGEMTPTLKLKRRAIEQEYAGVIDGLYLAPRAPVAPD